MLPQPTLGYDLFKLAMGAFVTVIPIMLYILTTRRDDKKERDRQHGENQERMGEMAGTLKSMLHQQQAAGGGLHCHTEKGDSTPLTVAGVRVIPPFNGD
jgi:hypothetical protein